MNGKKIFRDSLVGLIALVPVLIYSGIAYLFFTIYNSENKGPYTFTSLSADLDLDGDQDILMGRARYEAAMTVWAGPLLWLNQGGGRFILSQPDLPGSLAVSGGDIDQDGDTDLLTYGVYKATWVINQGGVQGGKAGSFPNTYVIPASPSSLSFLPMDGSLALGDLNGDGRLDGLVTSCCNPVDDSKINPATVQSWTFFREANIGDRLAFRTAPLPELDRVPVRATTLGDLDGDGDLDVYAAVGSKQLNAGPAAADRVLLNDGAGNLSDSGQRLGEVDSTAVALEDLDGDGDLDALVGTRKGAQAMINRGGMQGGEMGVLDDYGQVIAGPATTRIFLEDFDRDGALEALVAGQKWAYLWRLEWKDGRPAFKRVGPGFEYRESFGLAVGDFNGDSLTDVFAGASNGRYIVWTNQGNGNFSETIGLSGNEN
ncbi:protein containg repeat domain [Longilinea arvoryzae]|uniref:Protein containg repeat domain n=1 Tax=Longilinea arvoryzae TaxID=360412 RepID=A0A0S7BEN9_9CHLR|nr:VCBS repeat-containing protein [Longilinea arvoryzae]GAP12466.1 protein containg repeat domain [Longilinea arvoryzae]